MDQPFRKARPRRGTTLSVRAAVRTALALLAVAMLIASSAPVDAAPRGSSCGSGANNDSEPEGRPYLPGTEAITPSVRKYFAMTTINANGQRDSCECVDSRAVGHGMADSAVVSIQAAMDDKEAEAIQNYARFGVPTDQVPVEAMTIWVRTAWRSDEEQRCLYALYGSGQAALPGRSRHQFGYAVDIEDWGPQFFGQDDRLLVAHGWCRTVKAEPWHYEYKPILDSIGEGSRCK